MNEPCQLSTELSTRYTVHVVLTCPDFDGGNRSHAYLTFITARSACLGLLLQYSLTKRARLPSSLLILISMALSNADVEDGETMIAGFISKVWSIVNMKEYDHLISWTEVQCTFS